MHDQAEEALERAVHLEVVVHAGARLHEHEQDELRDTEQKPEPPADCVTAQVPMLVDADEAERNQQPEPDQQEEGRLGARLVAGLRKLGTCHVAEFGGAGLRPAALRDAPD